MVDNGGGFPGFSGAGIPPEVWLGAADRCALAADAPAVRAAGTGLFSSLKGVLAVVAVGSAPQRFQVGSGQRGVRMAIEIDLELVGGVVMNPPFDPTAAAGNLSAVSAVIAGFALAGFFLLIERTTSADVDTRWTYVRAMLLLFISFLTGSITSFLYAGTTGDVGFPRRAMYSFMFPANTLAISTFTLLCGLNVVMSVFSLQELANLARRISYVVIIFAVLRLLINTFMALDFFGTVTVQKMIIGLAALAPIVISSLIIRQNGNIRHWIEERTLAAFGYTAILTTLGIAFFQSPYPLIVDDSLVKYPFWLASIPMCWIATLGAWSMLLLPRAPVAATVEVPDLASNLVETISDSASSIPAVQRE